MNHQASRTTLPVEQIVLAAEAVEPHVNWEQIFGRPGPNAIEIGTGNGYFLESEAVRLPEWNFLGIEREPKFFWKMAQRCARAGLGNVRALEADAIEILDQHLPDDSVSRIYCYFSDPWPKRRHARRRVVNQDFPALLERILTAQGEFYFKTDVVYYFNLAVTVFRQAPHWHFRSVGKLPPPDPQRGEVYSNFERKGRQAGREIWGFQVCRTQSSQTGSNLAGIPAGPVE